MTTALIAAFVSVFFAGMTVGILIGKSAVRAEMRQMESPTERTGAANNRSGETQ